MNHIELFAGCGGLSIGLESEGFELLFANELSPMAAETFSYNLLKDNLQSGKPSNTYWVNSKYETKDLPQRLRENTLEAPENLGGFCDLENLDVIPNHSMLVGNIIDLNQLLMEKPHLLDNISGGVDLVSGGPPCQSFSLAGLREKDNHKNQLPWEFAHFVDIVKPKIALLENVTGILRAFNENGVKYHAWFEVAKAFASIGYVPICLHINAKYVGVAQNRPRFIMISIREDVFKTISETTTNPLESEIFINSYNFFTQRNNNVELSYKSLKYWDVEKDSNIYKSTFLSPLLTHNVSTFHTTKDAIDDLRNNGNPKSMFIKEMNRTLSLGRPIPRNISNNEERNNTPRVKARFRLYQIISMLSDTSAREVAKFLRNPDEVVLSETTCTEMLKFDYLDPVTLNYVTFEKNKGLVKFLKGLKTKKLTQKALLPNVPAPAALTIPDDACHYHHDEQRNLSVREMARIQSFPDWFEFRSKVTTGGKQRRYEVPQYTQVGNAVPPLLGKALGKVIKQLLCC